MFMFIQLTDQVSLFIVAVFGMKVLRLFTDQNHIDVISFIGMDVPRALEYGTDQYIFITAVCMLMHLQTADQLPFLQCDCGEDQGIGCHENYYTGYCCECASHLIIPFFYIQHLTDSSG